MKIIVDTREQDLLLLVKTLIETIPSFKDLEIVCETLPIGDIIISDGVEEKLIIERKSVNDLLSSIKDGRYKEQSYRLNGINHHNHNIVYLIEGDINKFNRFKDNRIEKLTLYSAIFSLNYYKGFSVIRTFNLDETAIFVCNSANKIRKEVEKSYYSNNKVLETSINKNITNEESLDNAGEIESNDKESNDKDYISVVKKVKKENITPDNISEIMLCQIPGISSVTAIAIMQKFKTIPELIINLEKDENCLKDITSINAKGQQRKINKTSAANIIKFLLKK